MGLLFAPDWCVNSPMRITHLLYASPLFLLLALPAAGGCGGSVVGGNGGTGTGASGTTGTSTGAGGAAFDLCSGPGQCVLVKNGCCDPCGMPELGDLTAIDGARAGEYAKLTCPEPLPCPACATATNPNLFAYCDGDHCKGADTRTDPVGACTADADCMLRFGTGCCDACAGDPSQLTAVNKNSNLASLVCAPGTGCPGCIPAYPPDAVALCQAGHCTVAFVNGG